MGEHFFRTQEAQEDFLSGMHGFGQLSSPAAVAAFNLGRFRQLVDLGGATVREHVGHSSSEPNTELIEGDFFTDPLPNLYWSYQRAPGRTAGTVRTNDVDFGRSS